MKTKVKKKLVLLTAIIALGVSTAFQSDFFEIAKQIDIYTTLFKELNMYYVDEVNPAKLTNTAINNMLQSLDPYTKYYDEQGVENAKIMATGEYGGIGVTSLNKPNYLLVKEIFKNSPAEKGGLIVGDQIIKIDNILVEHVDSENIAMLVNGLPGTAVNLTVKRNNKNLSITLVRAKININPVPYYTMVNKDIGYIAFIRFNEKAAIEVKRAYEQLKAEGMQKLIIDVRGNPGGLLHEAVNITNFFIPKNKVVVTTKAKVDKWSETYSTQNEPIDLDIPIVILIDGKSASASEILAGALQDYDRGIVVGERSFGKGLVQRYRELSYGTQMKLTISKYYTPSGRCIQELDYTNRDNLGNIPKFSDAGRATYTTANGRTVFGGGGILPDVAINKVKTTKTTEILLESDAFFNYVTQFYNSNTSIAKPTEFTLSNSAYNNLANYLALNQNSFTTTTERLLNEVILHAEDENINGTLNASYKQLLNAIQTEKLKELEVNKIEILQHLTEEIVKRYYYHEGLFQHKVVFDPTIKKAVNVLNNSTNYTKILKQ